LPLHTRRRVIEAVLNDILGLHNKPKAAVHSVHKLMGPKKKKKKKKTYKKKNQALCGNRVLRDYILGLRLFLISIGDPMLSPRNKKFL
jgi:hypothetical protein